MREGWELKKLVEVCEIKPLKKLAKETLGENELVSFIPMEDLGVMVKTIIPVKQKKLIEVIGSYTYFANNDVLLAKITPCFENGKLGIARSLTNGIGFGSSEYIVFRSKGYLHEEFLFYFLSQEKFREEGKKNMTGAVGHKRVSKEFIENYLIPLPPLPEQQRIVAILDECFAALEKAKANAEQNLKNSKELFESYLQGVFENKGEGWEEKKLGDVCDIKHGYAFEGNDFETDFYGSNPIVLTPGNFTEDCKLSFTTKNTKRLKVEYPKEYLFTVGELVVVMTDLSSLMKILGKPTIIDRDDILHNQRIGRFVFKESCIEKSYLFYFLQTNKYLNKVKESATGTMVRHTAPKRILNIEIRFPKSLQDQQTIVRQLDALRAETQKLEAVYQQKLADLEELKKSILQKAFAGELTDKSIA
jgi:type I restriction enzyme S subunit